MVSEYRRDIGHVVDSQRGELRLNFGTRRRNGSPIVLMSFYISDMKPLQEFSDTMAGSF